MPGKNTQTVQINDFSAGIYQYAVGTLPVSYSTSSPLGSASKAVRCINRPGIGLIPFYGYTKTFTDPLPSGNSPGGHSWMIGEAAQVGIGCVGGVGGGIVTSSDYDPPSQTYTYSDMIVTAQAALDSSSQFYIRATRWFNEHQTTQFDTNQIMFTVATGADQTMPCGVSFDNTSQNIPFVTGANEFRSILTMGFNSAQGGSYTPASVDSVTFEELPFGPPLWYVFASSNRVFASFSNFSNVHASPLVVIQQDDTLIYTDPPASFNNTTSINQGAIVSYTLEDASGFGAWGSISTGELVLIRRGQGAVIIYGDAAFPSSVIKLPAVQGTGQIVQKTTQCNQGALYVTEDAGVWVWNGQNTSAKVSVQIPDSACVRQELQYGGVLTTGVIGARSWHDCINGLVFLPNNWVFDSINNNWWQCEDPAVINFGAWVKSRAGSRFMYGIQGLSTNGLNYQGVSFDTTTLASSYEWTSNPIPSVAGNLSIVSDIELVASNPSSTPCTVTITPTIPAGQVSSFTNNPQSAIFTIPATTSAYRAVIGSGYQEYNICIDVVAANTNTSNPAPIIHAINVAFVSDHTAEINA